MVTEPTLCEMFNQPNCPHLPLQAARMPLPHFVWQHYLHNLEEQENFIMLTLPLPMLKGKGKTQCMV